MQLFAEVKYFIASSLPSARQTELRHVLDSNGAVKVDSVTDATHIITNSSKFEGWESAKGDAAIVTDKWIDQSLVLSKLQSPRHYSAEPSMIFSGVVACATELPTADVEVLSAGITALGGQWRTGLSRDVTHLFAISADSSKYATALHFQHLTKVRVVLPHWFDDAVRLGMGNLGVEPYEWPDPPLLQPLPGPGEDKELMKKALDNDNAASKKELYATAALYTHSQASGGLPDEIPSGEKSVWAGRKILLSRTLELYAGRREAVEVGVSRAGGEVVRYGHEGEENVNEARANELDRLEAKTVKDCDIFVTRWRSGKAYAKAFKTSKTIGSLAWLFHVQSTGIISRPLDQLLHYPIPKNPIEGFSFHEVTVTNYTGEAREYLKKLITAMGATFTPSMTGRNTVLIAAFISGIKATKAAAWSIPIVNHTWLEDCFIQWRNLTVGVEKYVVFPPGVDFSLLLGERGVGARGVELLEDEEDDGEEVDDKDVIKEPSGTEASIKEVQEVEGLVDEDGDAVMKVEVDEDHNDRRSEKDAKQEKTQTPRRKLLLDLESPLSAAPSSTMAKKSVLRNRKSDDKLHHTSKTKVKSRKSASKTDLDNPVRWSDSDDAMDVDQDTVVIVPSAAKRKTIKGVNPLKSHSKGSSDNEESDRKVTTEAKILAKGKQRGKEASPIIIDDVQADDNIAASEDEDSDVKIVKSVKPKQLVRRVSARHLPEDAESEIESPSKPITSSRGLLKLKTGDARTRVKKKAKERVQLSADESDGSDKDAAVQAKGKAKAKSQTNPKKGTKKKTVLRGGSVSQEDEADDKVGIEKGTKKKTAQRGGSVSQEDEVDVEVEVKKGRKKTAQREASVSQDDEADVPVESEEEMVVSVPVLRSGARPVRRLPVKDTPAVKTITPRKSTGDNQNEQSPSQSLRRQVSVVIRPLTLTTKSSTSKGKATGEIVENGTPRRSKRTEDIRLTAKEKAQTSPVRPVAKTTPLPSSSSVNNPPAPPAISSPPATTLLPKRSAATKAQQRLHDEIMPDVMNFQQEMRKSRRSGSSVGTFGVSEAVSTSSRRKRASTSPHLRKESSEEDEDDNRHSKKRKVVKNGTKPKPNGKKKAQPESQSEEDADEAPSQNEKVAIVKPKNRNGKEPPPTKTLKEKKSDAKLAKAKADTDSISNSTKKPVRLMTTQVTLGDDVVKALTKLGVKVVTRPVECTHLVASHLVRTEKFLCALAAAPYIISDKWAVESAKAKKLLPETDYLLRDKAGEKKYDFVLSEALERAKALQGNLFSKRIFYITPHVPVDIKLLKNVVTACGGQIASQTPTPRILNASANRHVISCPGDISIWRSIAAQGYPVYSQELILTGALKQEVEWDNEEFRVPESMRQ